jgi:hypothetical protein
LSRLLDEIEPTISTATYRGHMKKPKPVLKDRVVRRPPPCPQCDPLGSFDHEGKHYDLYFCLVRLHGLPIVDPEWPDVMARFGDGPDDFTDGMAVADRDPVLGEARRRAIERGLYDPKKPLSPQMKRFVEALAELLLADRSSESVQRNGR